MTVKSTKQTDVQYRIKANRRKHTEAFRNAEKRGWQKVCPHRAKQHKERRRYSPQPKRPADAPKQSAGNHRRQRHDGQQDYRCCHRQMPDVLSRKHVIFREN